MLVPALSCHDVILDVCLSLASDTALPDTEPTAMIQQAYKLLYFLRRMRRLMGQRLSWHWEHNQRENTAKEITKTVQGTTKRSGPP